MKGLALLALAAVAQAAQVKFNVIAPGATTVQVSVNGQLTELKAADPTVPFYTGTAETGADTKYKYVVGQATEAFDRTLPTGGSTLNDFFDRPITYANIPELPWPIEKNPQWTRSGAKQPLFDTNYIPTIFIVGDKAQLDGLIQVPVSTKFPVTMTVILSNEVKTLKNVSFGIHGAGKKKNNAKQSWNMQLGTGETWQNRDFFKLRHMEEDPTQIREKLYADISRAMGTYANEANTVRLFINGDGMGTFNLLDDITQYSFVRAMFYDGKPPEKMGALFDGGTGASFAVTPDMASLYSFVPNPQSPEQVQALEPFCQAWNSAVKTDDAAIAEIEKQFELDIFMRFMVMEYLAGHWDGYWEMQTNIGVYRDPTDNNRWYFIGQDFDGTFGINNPQPINETILWSYKDLETKFPNAVLINGLLQNPNRRATFESYLTNTVKVLFNNYTLTNRVLKYHEFILPDLKWDRSIVQRSPGIDMGWTFQQTIDNLWQYTISPKTGGGPGMGLIEWIAQRSQRVANEFKIEITKEPVGPPTTGGNKPPAGGNNGGN
ncbi:MAG: coth protein-domain-containing protein, partial [Benniella sp.]